MKDWFKKNWYWVAIGIVALIVLYVIYKAIKKSGRKPHQVDPGSDTVGDYISPEDIQKLKAMAENCREDIYEVFGFRDTDLWKEVGRLGDNKLVALSNIYNEMYEVDDNETFYQALDNETFNYPETKGVVDNTLKRLRALGVS